MVKQTAQEGLASHHEHARAGIKVGEAMVKRGGVHSGHDGASNGDGGVPVAMVDKMIKQQGVKHHGNKVKLEQPYTRTEVHRGALATTVALSAVKKKDDKRRFPAKSSDQSGLAGCARSRRSCGKLC